MITSTLRAPVRRAGLVTALLLFFGTVFATPALAHTRLLSSTPGKDATATGVSQVELVFSDKISMAKVLVKNEKGKEFQTGPAARSGPEVTQKLTGALPAGTYTVAYAVVGEDGHRIEKADLKFTATAGEQLTGAQGAATTTPAADPPVTDSKAVKESSSGGAKWVMIVVGALIGIGIGMVIVYRAKRDHGAGSGGE
ncbi:copper resistance protein CopC [Spirillospora sp. NPDC048911]|uniref:copper resistance CopC family protein n=1 Tax=Spirillospora sp. NPDC048911 TaxID=3364527 RepID=UPI003720B393